MSTIAMTILAALGALLWAWRRPQGRAPIDWRGVLARLPLPMLALAASWGVYSYSALYVPMLIAIIQAAAFELTYIGLAVTRGLDAGQRRRATAISLGAVVVSVLYNSIDGLFARNPSWLAALPPWAEIAGAVLHGAPLAIVAYLVADLLLHSGPVAAAQPTVETVPTMHLGDAVYARPDAPADVHFSPPAPGEMQTPIMQAVHHVCPNCGATLNAKQYAAAKRWKRCAACKQ